MKKLFMFFFGCSHSRTTFPMALRKGGPAHITCLNCGKEFTYSWKDMRVESALAVDAVVAPGRGALSVAVADRRYME